MNALTRGNRLRGYRLADDDEPLGLDNSAPSAARLSNCLLGGKDHSVHDEAVIDRMLEVAPDARMAAQYRRSFALHAAVLAADAGVRQFIDIGVGFPAEPPVHQAIQRVARRSRVVAVDYDHVVVTHCRALWHHEDNVTTLLGDVREPDLIIDGVKDRIDLDEPVAILMTGVLDFVLDTESPAEIIATFHEAITLGSYLVISHGSNESDSELMARSVADTRGSPAQIMYRSPSEVSTLLKGFQLIAPGIVPVQQWLPENLPATSLVILGGVGRKV